MVAPSFFQSFSNNETIMVLYHFFGDGQANTGAFIIFAAMQALEQAEYLFAEFGIEPGAVIRDGNMPVFSLPVN